MYCTLERYIEIMHPEHVVQQSNWDPQELLVNNQFMVSHLIAASALVDAEISKRHKTPVMPAPKVLEVPTAFIAEWIASQLGEIPAPVKEHSEWAFCTIKRIGDGELNLLDSTGGVISPTPGDQGSEVLKRIDMPMYSGNSGAGYVLPTGKVTPVYVPNFGARIPPRL